MKVTAIVPAYNEGPRIHSVLEALVSSQLIDQIIVVDDGSDDNTCEVASQYPVEVIVLSENQGKGAAVSTGIASAQNEIILMLDADLVGLTSDHIYELLQPLLEDDADMTLGLFEEGRFITDISQKITPWLTGQRAVKTDLLKEVDQLEDSEYGLETSITMFAKKNNLDVREVYLSNLSHVMKEEKIGRIKGLAARFKMYANIVKTFVNRSNRGS